MSHGKGVHYWGRPLTSQQPWEIGTLAGPDFAHERAEAQRKQATGLSSQSYPWASDGFELRPHLVGPE